MRIRISVFRTSLTGALAAALSLSMANPLLAQSSPSLANAPVSRNAAAAAPDAPFHGEVVEDIVARVNNQVISSSDYARAENELEQQGKQRNWSQGELDDQKKQLLRDLIDNQLLLSKGKQLGITGETETIRQLDDLRKQNNLDSMEALEKAAEQQGVSFADFKASIQNRVITSQVIREDVGRRINITGADEQAYYDAHKDQFSTPEQVKLSEILIPTADPDNAAQVAEAQTKADAVTAQLKAGKNFAEVAKASSGGPTAAQGGALGDFKRGQLADVLEKATFSLQPGQYTEPVRTKQGFVILKVDEHTPAGEQPFTAVQPQVEEAVGMEKMQPALRAYLTRLREEASIDIKPGYLDAGSSRNEMRPIFSAYQPPQPKKKKKVDRTRFAGRGRTRGTVQVASKSAPALSPAVPAGVPSLADVPGGSGAGATTASGPGTPAGSGVVGPDAGATGTQTAAMAPPAPVASASSKVKTGVQKPAKREKVRFGQAPRETLPAAASAPARDGGAAATGADSSTSEVASASEPQVSSSGAANAPANVRYSNGESATEDQAAAGPKTKTRFSERARVTRAEKQEKKRAAKVDPYPTAPADAQEIADKRTQDQPLGLAGDTSKKQPKPKPTSKTRYSDEAGKKSSPDTAQPDSATTPGAPGSTGTAATGGANTTPAVTTQPYQEPSPQAAPGTNAPVNTQTTPTGSGDPLGSPTPAPGTPSNNPPAGNPPQ